MENIIVKEATLNDAQLIALLGRITFTETFGHYFRNLEDLQNYYNNTFSVEKIKNSILNPNNVFWIAFYNQLPVGYAKLKLNSTSNFIEHKKTSQLQKIYVLKDFLTKQIGRELQNCAIDRALVYGSKQIWLSVLQSNIRAISFYTKTGFTNIGTHNFQIGIEDFNFNVMQKYLT
ncbi:GNAT family N-acetyltransferase [Lutibacter sp.]|uniref:GNAT family N-acetyltransferase n=1 Tax=Lutibacter sp. TaxID=1925666 RepID=UPI0027323254|nr:GNAT family N-acetyltransferase [Lutibacter sp.]MDP3312715.1 GNAT family N-acetyltransferase [Lutibacter sp.]